MRPVIFVLAPDGMRIPNVSAPVRSMNKTELYLLSHRLSSFSVMALGGKNEREGVGKAAGQGRHADRHGAGS